MLNAKYTSLSETINCDTETICDDQIGQFQAVYGWVWFQLQRKLRWGYCVCERSWGMVNNATPWFYTCTHFANPISKTHWVTSQLDTCEPNTEGPWLRVCSISPSINKNMGITIVFSPWSWCTTTSWLVSAIAPNRDLVYPSSKPEKWELRVCK